MVRKASPTNGDAEPPRIDNLRLINGMQPRAPELTVVVRCIRKNSRSRNFELILGRVVDLRHWSRKHERPARG